MDYEAVAERVSVLPSRRLEQSLIPHKLGCSGNAVSKHLQRLRTEIQDKNHPIPLVRPGTVIGSNARIDRLNFTEAAGLLAAKLDDSNGRSGLPKATRTKDALFVKNEIAKLEANLREDNELTPWSKEEESALERGLRRFSGPYWSDILGLFGPNGSVSDVLKDRNEAQLDNKACRMKISFLKSGVKFPFYLRMVNGDARRQRPQ